MAVIPILVVVDSTGIAVHGVNGNVYMFDDQGYQGEQEGGNELTTNCKDGDVINWRIVTIQSENSGVSMNHFRGQAVDASIIRPQEIKVPIDFWSSRVELAGNSPGSYQYSFDIVIDGKSFPFDPFLNISR